MDVLEREKFTDDELLREGLEEDVPAGVVRFRIVEKLVGGSGSNGYNEVLVENDELVIQDVILDVDMRICVQMLMIVVDYGRKMVNEHPLCL
jgi:hypothetical protein